jgi:hypothetical protein
LVAEAVVVGNKRVLVGVDGLEVVEVPVVIELVLD